VGVGDTRGGRRMDNGCWCVVMRGSCGIGMCGATRVVLGFLGKGGVVCNGEGLIRYCCVRRCRPADRTRRARIAVKSGKVAVNLALSKKEGQAR